MRRGGSDSAALGKLSCGSQPPEAGSKALPLPASGSRGVWRRANSPSAGGAFGCMAENQSAEPSPPLAWNSASGGT